MSKKIKKCGDKGVVAGRGPGQLGWYEFCAHNFLSGKETILDVGCGTGKGLRILSKRSRKAHGIDLDPRLKDENIFVMDVKEITPQSYDIVTCIDVIEHVEDDTNFVKELNRIARKGLFITTPNYTAGRNTWPYHVREYTPFELYNLLKKISNNKEILLYKGNPRGTQVFIIKYKTILYLFNWLRIFKFTAPFARILNFAVPPKMKINSHLGAYIYK